MSYQSSITTRYGDVENVKTEDIRYKVERLYS